jgi:transketolase
MQMTIDELQKIANKVRKDVVKMITAAGSGHPAGSLGITDVLVALYFGLMRHDPKNPDWQDRDRLILSCGHVAPAQYACLARAGYFSTAKLGSLRKLGGLQGHHERTKLAGVEITSGPLGSGLAQAVGISLAARLDDKRFRVYCITSDGEHDEGNHWEAVLVACKYALSNLTLFVDRNKIQLSGDTGDIMPIEPLLDKYKSFGWNVLEIDGNDINAIIAAVKSSQSEYKKPTVIIADTIAGKGVGFMEGKWQWHGKVLSEEEAKIALRELGTRQ